MTGSLAGAREEYRDAEAVAEDALRVASATRLYLEARSGWKSGRARPIDAHPWVERPMKPIPRGFAGFP